MGWQDKANKMAMGKFVRAKMGRGVIIAFMGEPVEAVGKDFDQNPIDELRFPVKFYWEGPANYRFKPGEVVGMVKNQAGEDKIFPVSSPPLIRELREEDETESVMGKTFLLLHTGAGKETSYKFREIKVPLQATIASHEEDGEEDSDFMEEEEEEEPRSGPHPRKDAPRKPPVEPEQEEEEEEAPVVEKKKRKSRVTKPALEEITEEKEPENIKPVETKPKAPIDDGERKIRTVEVFVKDGKLTTPKQAEAMDKERAKFRADVEKRAAKVKVEEAAQDPPDEPDYEEDDGTEEE